MAIELKNLNLFGLDLGRIGTTFRQGWSEAMRWPAFRWLTPLEPVRVLYPDGRESWRRGATIVPAAPAAGAAARAVLLPEDLVLMRALVMPDLLASDLQAALDLQAAEHSPFAADDRVWGADVRYRTDGRLGVRFALSSRAQISAYLAAQTGPIPSEGMEVWAGSPDENPIVIRGYGEGAREQRTRRLRLATIGSLLVLTVMLIALAAAPFFVIRAKVLDATAQHAALTAVAAQALAEREAIVKGRTQGLAMQSVLSEQASIARLLEALTRVLPDEAYLTRLEVNGRHVRLAGFAANAAALVEALAVEPGMAEVRMPGAISRSGDGRESFGIEFQFREHVSTEGDVTRP